MSISDESRRLFGRERGAERDVSQRDDSRFDERARELLRDARRTERANEEAARDEESFERFEQSSRLIAVRVGPAPIEDLARSPADTSVAAGLEQRARLRNFEQVLSLPDPASERARAAVSERTEVELPPLPGLETRDAVEAGLREPRSERAIQTLNAREPVDRPGLLRNPATTPGDPRRSESPGLRSEREAAEDTLRPELTLQSLGRASSVAPQTGVVSESRDSGREQSATADSVSRNAASEDAETEITQIGTLEASAAESIVTRFLSNVESEDPGPVPRRREVLGERPLA